MSHGGPPDATGRGLALQGSQIRIRNQYGVEKHGTLMAFFKGYEGCRGPWDPKAQMHQTGKEASPYPISCGNMQTGDVVEAGPEAKKFKKGETVFFWSGFQPVSVIPEEKCYLLKDGVSWKSALLLDPAEFALGAVRDSHARVGDNVAVFGLGAIGLVAVQIARLSGAAKVIAIDPLANRRDAARQLGADATIDPAGADVGRILREMTDGRGPDAVIDFSGSPHALQSAIRGICYLGTIVCGAYPPPHATGLDFGGEAHMNRPRIVFSRACSSPDPDHPRWNYGRIRATCLELIAQGRLDGEPIVTPIVPFDDLLEEYPKIASAPESSIKLCVRYSN